MKWIFLLALWLLPSITCHELFFWFMSKFVIEGTLIFWQGTVIKMSTKCTSYATQNMMSITSYTIYDDISNTWVLWFYFMDLIIIWILRQIIKQNFYYTWIQFYWLISWMNYMSKLCDELSLKLIFIQLWWNGKIHFCQQIGFLWLFWSYESIVWCCSLFWTNLSLKFF